MRREGVAITLKPWATIVRIASAIRPTSARVKCCAPLGPPSTTAQRGPGSEASRRSGAARAAAMRAGEKGCGEVKVVTTLAPRRESCSGAQIKSISERA